MNNSLGNAIDIAQDKTKYDSNIKEILAHKEILAWIVRDCCQEFNEMDICDIINCIDGNIEVESVPVYPGLTNAKIEGASTEDIVSGEGKVIYDIRFRIKVPSKEMQEIIINVESQKDYYPGYPLEVRGVFYCARMISAQTDIDFSQPYYGDIKKVYSIWLCTQPPKKEGNSLTTYKVEQYNLFGNHPKTNSADLLEVVLLCLQEEGKETTRLHSMLNTILSPTISTVEKKRQMEEVFGISVSKSLEGGLDKMCNLSEAIEERGIKIGIEKGIEKGIERGAMLKVLELVQKGIISAEIGAKELSCTVSEFEELMEKNGIS